MQNIKPKFTPRPWRFRDKTYGKYRFLTVVNDASPMVIIANMPSLHDIPLREWKNAYDIDEVAANAALIVSAPELYANEEANLEVLKILVVVYQEIENLVATDADVQNVLGPQVTTDVVHGIVFRLRQRIEATEKILAKARGEAETCKG